MTQEKLAWECDISKSHLSQIESGRRYPSIPVLAGIARRLDLSLLDLVAVDPGDPRVALIDALRSGDGTRIASALKAAVREGGGGKAKV